MYSNEVQSGKALSIFVIELGIVIEVSEEQPEKAHAPIDLTELGIEIDVSELQFMKADTPIVAIELGIEIDSRLVQFLKAHRLISVMLGPTITLTTSLGASMSEFL
jgi:hypothetical protein